MSTKNNHQLLVDGVFDILEAFPDLEPQLKDLIAALVLRETTLTEFESNVKSICLAHIRKQTQAIKKGLKSNDSLLNAYYDVARYMTDPSDAAEEWKVDEEILLFILERRPPPTDPHERTMLETPTKVIKLRTFTEDYQAY